MADTILNKLINSIKGTALFESGSVVRPEVILWCDPDSQWQSIIPVLQQEMPYLLVLGNYNASTKTGPAIWLKCMIAKTLPEADWSATQTPIIYLPGIAKQDFKNLTNARTDLMPLMEYQYTGAMWLHRNGKEWTVNAFLQNPDDGMGLNISQDNATREAAIKALTHLVSEKDIVYPGLINSDYLYSLLFPNEAQSILKWFNEKDAYIQSLEPSQQQVFTNICLSRYDFKPDAKDIQDIILKFAYRKNYWLKVWDTYVASPQKYPWIEDLLRKYKPADLGSDMFAIPVDSFPQSNEEQEEILHKEFENFANLSYVQAAEKIIDLEKKHAVRRTWVWSELGKAPLAQSLPYFSILAAITSMPVPSANLQELSVWYHTSGHKADYAAIKALSLGTSISNKAALTIVIRRLYSEWLNNLAVKFQSLVQKDTSIFNAPVSSGSEEEFYLFVDAFRYDIASAFADTINKKHKVILSPVWSPLPTVTATAKPAMSPASSSINTSSECKEFRPQTGSGKDLQHAAFKDELLGKGYTYINDFSAIIPGNKYWMEIGSIDKTGHNEKSGLVKRIDELFTLITETIDSIFNSRIRNIKIVTDHGWLLLPGGLPKTELPAYHTDTRWGRCALIKEGVKSELLHLPWRWNNFVLIAFAPGINFFRAGEEYAHGGISLQECFIPAISIENGKQKLRTVTLAAKWTHLKCSLEITGADTACKVMIRTKHNDPESKVSVIKNISTDGKVALFVEDIDLEGTAAFIVITENDGTVIHKQPITIGE